MKRILYIIAIYLLASALMPVQAQTLEQARKLYSQGEYEQALPVFKRELKYAKKDASINYWYGSCLYHTGRKQEAVPYLKVGEKGRIKEASFLLADCSFEARDYEQCIKHIDQYILYNTGSHKAELANMLRVTEKVKKMLENVEDVVFLDSVTIPKDKVLSVIRLHPACGHLEPGSYHTEKGDRYYSSEVVTREAVSDSLVSKDLDLYLFTKMLGSWERAQLDDNINKEGSDQTNPYLLSDGITVYFASNEEGGIGGYDLYVSRYNDYTGTYYHPELLPMPFNSTANDLMYIIDEEVGRGYLVTDRNGYQDSLTVYTFLPNDQRRILKGKSAAETALYARIASVAATQKGVNVDSIRSAQEAAYKDAEAYVAPVVEQVEASQTEGFVIRDGIVYTSASDFKCPEAKVQYAAWQRILRESETAEKKLSDARKRYTEIETSTGAAVEKERAALVKTILEEEPHCADLSEALQQAANEARRLEIEFLKK